MHLRRAVFVLTLTAIGGVAGPADALATEELSGLRDEVSARVDADPAYGVVAERSIHNAYARAESLSDQLLHHQVRSLEVDVHVRRAGERAPPGEWFVYHEDLPFMRKTSCATLSDCVRHLRAFHAAIPEHDVVTLFVDLKDRFESGHEPSDLDGAIAAGLGRENIVTPRDLIHTCEARSAGGAPSSVRAAVTGGCAFPPRSALRGKFIIATTGGTACDRSSPVASYGGAEPRTRLAFLGPNVDATCGFDAYDARPDIVFFNFSFLERARARDVRRHGLIARVYGGGLVGGLDNARDFAAARSAGAAHLATDAVSTSDAPWSVTSPSLFSR